MNEILIPSWLTHWSWEKTSLSLHGLTHWGRVTHIGVSKLTIIVSDNGLSPGRRQAIIWTNAGILLNRPLGTSFNEILIEILTFSFIKMRFKVSSAKWRPFCLGLNVLIAWLCTWPWHQQPWYYIYINMELFVFHGVNVSKQCPKVISMGECKKA